MSDDWQIPSYIPPDDEDDLYVGYEPPRSQTRGVPFSASDINAQLSTHEYQDYGWYDAAPSQSKTYDDYLVEALRYGVTQEQARRTTPEAAFTTFDDAVQSLEAQAAPGYSDYLGRVREWNAQRRINRQAEMAPVSPLEWSQYPEHLRQRRLQGEAVQRNEYGGVDVPEGHIYRAGGEFTYPTSVLESSWLGQTDEGYLSTFEPKKLTKRVQMLGAHQKVRLSSRPEFQAVLKSGRGASVPERLTPLKGAFVIGGSPGPSGQMYMDPSVGNVTGQIARDVYAPDLEPAAVGSTWRRGERVQLAPGLTGWKDRRWDHTLRDVAPISRVNKHTGQEESGYRFLLERSARAGSVGFGAKFGATKNLVSVAPVRDAVTDAQGNPLGLDFYAELKDVQGLAYMSLQRDLAKMAARPTALGRERGLNKIAREMGYEDFAAVPASYGELGRGALNRLADQAGARIQTIHVPRLLHESKLPLYEQAGTLVGKEPWTNPLTGWKEPRWQAQVAYQAWIGDVGAMFMDEPDVRQATLGPEDLENLRSVNPGLARVLEQEAGGRRQVYRDVINASLATSGDRRADAVSYQDPAFQKAIVGGISQAEARVREELEMAPDEIVKDQSAVAHQFAKVMAEGDYGSQFIDWGEGRVQAPFQSLQHFGAEGILEGREATTLLNSVLGMGKSVIGGVEGDFLRYRQTFSGEQRQIAASEQAFRRTEGVTPPRSRLAGYKIMGSDALAPNEVYFPGMDEGRVGSLVRFPTAGEDSFSPLAQAVNVGREQAAVLGLDPERAYAPMELQQAVGGDWDADIDYFLSAGWARRRGDKLYDTAGNPLTYQSIIEMGARRLAEGAGNLAEENVGVGKPAPTREQAVQQFQEAARNPHVMSEDVVRRQVAEGSKLSGRIGPYFQNMRRLFSMALDPAARRGVQGIWNRSHGRAQRPDYLEGEVQWLQDLLTPTKFGGIWRKEAEYATGLGTLKNLPGFHKKTAEVMGDLVKAGAVSTEAAASVMADDEAVRGELAGAFAQHAGTERLYPEVWGSQKPEEWARGGAAGRAIGGGWANKVRQEAEESGMNVNKVFEQRGVSAELGQELLGHWDEQQAYLGSLKKGEKAGTTIEQIAADVQASGRGEWLAPLAGEAASPSPPRESLPDYARAMGTGVKSGIPQGIPGMGLSVSVGNSSQQAPATTSTPIRRGPAGFQDLGEAVNYLIKTVGKGALGKFVSGGIYQDRATTFAAKARQNDKSIRVGQRFFSPEGVPDSDVPAYQRRGMLHEFGHLLQQQPEFGGVYQRVQQLVGQAEIPFQPGEVEAAQLFVEAGGGAFRLENEVFAEFTASALGERMQSPGFIDWNAMDPAIAQEIEGGIRKGLGRPTPTKAKAAPKKQATTALAPAPGGGGRGSDDIPPEVPLSDEDHVGDTDDERGSRSGQPAPQGRQGGWWNRANPMAQFGNNLRRQMDEAAKGLETWGESIGEAILSTDELNKGQRHFLREFGQYRKAYEKAGDTISQLERVQQTDEYRQGSQGFRRRVDADIQAAVAARTRLEGGVGFQTMLAASGHAGDLDRGAMMEEALGGGGPVSRSTAAEAFFRELTFGGAFFKMMGVRRLLGQPVQEWMGEAQAYSAEQIGFAQAMGASPETILSTPMGQMQAWQAQYRSMQAGLGMGSMEARAGLAGLVGLPIDYGTGQAAGRYLGPAMTGAQYGLGAGIIASTVGKFAPLLGEGLLGSAAAGVGGAAGAIGLGVGGVVAGGLMLGQSYQMAEPASLRREAIAQAMGYGARPDILTRTGAFLHASKRMVGEAWSGQDSRLGGESYLNMWVREQTASSQEYIKTSQFQIDKATVYLEKAKIEGLDMAQRSQVAGALGLVGVTPEDISSGRAYSQMQRLAPMAMGGTLDSTMSAAVNLGRSLGIAPGEGLAAYFRNMPLTQQGQYQYQMAGDALGGIARQTGAALSPALVGQYADQLAGEMPTWRLELQAQQQLGAFPVVSAMGYTPGTPTAKLISSAVSPPSLGAAQAQAQIATQYADIAALRRMDPGVAAQYYERLERERAGGEYLVKGQDGDWATRWEAGISPSAQRRREEAAAGAIDEVRYFGFEPGGAEARALMGQIAGAPDDGDLRSRSRWLRAMEYAGPVYQATGGGMPEAAALQQQFYGMLDQGVSPAALGIISQQMTGGGAVGAALGMPAGFRSRVESPYQQALMAGQMSAMQYNQQAAMAQFATGDLGYSMATGGWGAGPGARSFLEQHGMAIPEGAGPLYEPGPSGGIYPANALEQRRLQQEIRYAQHAKQMGAGAWATQEVSPFGPGMAYGGQTFQMGISGNIEQAQEHYGTWKATTGLQSRIFEANAAHQASGIAHAIASAQMQYRHNMESLNLQQQMWGVNTAFQRQQFGFQWEQMQRGQEWGREDFAFNRQVAGLEYGWQMDDLNRSIRFATGREKESLIRQRERTEERFTIQEGRRATQEERQEEVWQSEEEQFAVRLQHFEEIKALENEQFEMRKRHLTEAFNLQMAHLQEQAGHAQHVLELQREITELQNKQSERDQLRRIAELEQAEAFYAEMFGKQEELASLQKENEDRRARQLEFELQKYEELMAAMGGAPTEREGAEISLTKMDKLEGDGYTEQDAAIAAQERVQTLRNIDELQAEIDTFVKASNETTLEFQEAISQWVAETLGEDGSIRTHLVEIKKLYGDLNDEYERFIGDWIKSLEPGGRFYKAWEEILDWIEFWVNKFTGAGQRGREKKARGGPVYEGQSYIIGEQGEELFVPEADGRIIPHEQLMIEDALAGRVSRQRAAVSVGNVSIHVPAGDYDEERLAQAIRREFERAVNDLAYRQEIRGDSW